MKNKILKYIVIFLIVLLFIYAIIVISRFNILNNLCENNRKYSEKNNYSITRTYSDSKEIYLHKDNIYKLERTYLPDEITIQNFWYNSDSNEKYLYFDKDGKKYYEICETADVESQLENWNTLNIPTGKDETFKRLLYAMNITNSIQKTTFNGKDCYIFKYKNTDIKEQYIEKETGLCIFEKYQPNSYSYVDGEKTYSNEISYEVSYEFDKITDSDIQKPDFSEYELISNS